jgi:hypothetical protein
MRKVALNQPSTTSAHRAIGKYEKSIEPVSTNYRKKILYKQKIASQCKSAPGARGGVALCARGAPGLRCGKEGTGRQEITSQHKIAPGARGGG